MTTKIKITNLREASKVQRQLNMLADALGQWRSKQDFTKNKKIVGKCYRYSNSHGTGDRWWLYVKVTGINSDGWLSAIRFQKTSSDRYEIEVDSSFSPLSGYEEIGEALFQIQWMAFSDDIEKLRP